MKVGLIQINGKMVNLALLKLHAWHKQRGDDCICIDLSEILKGCDRVYGSKIFMGGTGIAIKASLPPEIEAIVPDYDAFNMDYSIGFTTRGCIRDCGFCIVREKEGYLSEKDMSFIKHSKVILMDNNFLASKKWKEKLQYFIDNDIKVNFQQGLDIRLIDEEKAEMISRVKYYDRKFVSRQIYFAWDNMQDEKIFREKLPVLLKYILPHHVMVYMLCGFNTTLDQDLYRYKALWEEFGVLPYVQIYNNKKGKALHLFAKWINKRIHKTYSWESWQKMKKVNK